MLLKDIIFTKTFNFSKQQGALNKCQIFKDSFLPFTISFFGLSRSKKRDNPKKGCRCCQG